MGGGVDAASEDAVPLVLQALSARVHRSGRMHRTSRGRDGEEGRSFGRTGLRLLMGDHLSFSENGEEGHYVGR